MKPADIDTKWKAQLAEGGAYDHGGDNPDCPERLLVKIEDYIDAKHRKRQATEVVRETSNDRRFWSRMLRRSISISVLRRPGIQTSLEREAC